MATAVEVVCVSTKHFPEGFARSHGMQEFVPWPARAFAALSERERYILTRRLDLDRQGRTTLREVGAVLGITGTRVNQVAYQALRKLFWERGHEVWGMKHYGGGRASPWPNRWRTHPHPWWLLPDAPGPDAAGAAAAIAAQRRREEART
jgi:hypothetical protein